MLWISGHFPAIGKAVGGGAATIGAGDKTTPILSNEEQ
jgi:hypothetical protein